MDTNHHFAKGKQRQYDFKKSVSFFPLAYRSFNQQVQRNQLYRMIPNWSYFRCVSAHLRIVSTLR